MVDLGVDHGLALRKQAAFDGVEVHHSPGLGVQVVAAEILHVVAQAHAFAGGRVVGLQNFLGVVDEVRDSDFWPVWGRVRGLVFHGV